jgi:hypothetical protein
MQIFTGYNNWISASVQLENDCTHDFDISFSATDVVKDLEFNQAADYTANLISKNYSNIHLLLSGGLDSEYVATVFVRNNLSFIPVILVNQTNIPEVWYAFRFCEEHNLKPVVLDYSGSYQDHTAFLKNLYDLSLRLKIKPNLGILSNFVATKLKNVALLTGCGDTLGKRPDNNFRSHLEPNGGIFSLEDSSFFLHLEKTQHPGPFFLYTPEIFQAYLKTIDFNKPGQIAKSNLYNILPRSKIVYDLHLISDSVVIKNMIEQRLQKLKHIENEVVFDKDLTLRKLNQKLL